MVSGPMKEKRTMRRGVNDLPRTITLLVGKIIDRLLGQEKVLVVIRRDHPPGTTSTHLLEIETEGNANQVKEKAA